MVVFFVIYCIRKEILVRNPLSLDDLLLNSSTSLRDGTRGPRLVVVQPGPSDIVMVTKDYHLPP